MLGSVFKFSTLPLTQAGGQCLHSRFKIIQLRTSIKCSKILASYLQVALGADCIALGSVYPVLYFEEKTRSLSRKPLSRGRAAIWCRHRLCCVPQYTIWLGERSSAETLRPLDLAMGLAPEVVLCQGKPRSHLDFNLDPTFEDTFFSFFLKRK